VAKKKTQKKPDKKVKKVKAKKSVKGTATIMAAPGEEKPIKEAVEDTHGPEVTDEDLKDFFDDEYPEESDYDMYPREENKAYEADKEEE